MIPIRELQNVLGVFPKKILIESVRRIDGIDIRWHDLDSIVGPEVVNLYKNGYLYEGLYLLSTREYLKAISKPYKGKVGAFYLHNVYLLEWKDNRFRLVAHVMDRVDWYTMCWMYIQQYYEGNENPRYKRAMVKIYEKICGLPVA